MLPSNTDHRLNGPYRAATRMCGRPMHHVNVAEMAHVEESGLRRRCGRQRGSNSYAPDLPTESAFIDQHILKQNPNAKICILLENDDFGRDCTAGVRDVLGDKCAATVKEAIYEFTDASIDRQIVELKATGWDALIACAGPAGCGRGLGFGFFRRPTAPRHARADRRKARRYRAAYWRIWDLLESLKMRT